MFTMLRGVAERKWFHENPDKTKEEFVHYFEALQSEQLQVCRTAVSSSPTNVTLQEFKETAMAEVISTHI